MAVNVNAVVVNHGYKPGGLWVFDDEAVGRQLSWLERRSDIVDLPGSSSGRATMRFELPRKIQRIKRPLSNLTRESRWLPR